MRDAKQQHCSATTLAETDREVPENVQETSIRALVSKTQGLFLLGISSVSPCLAERPHLSALTNQIGFWRQQTDFSTTFLMNNLSDQCSDHSSCMLYENRVRPML